MVNVCGALVSSPPPSSWARTVTCAVPCASGAGVKVSVPAGRDRGLGGEERVVVVVDDEVDGLAALERAGVDRRSPSAGVALGPESSATVRSAPAREGRARGWGPAARARAARRAARASGARGAGAGAAGGVAPTGAGVSGGSAAWRLDGASRRSGAAGSAGAGASGRRRARARGPPARRPGVSTGASLSGGRSSGTTSLAALATTRCRPARARPAPAAAPERPDDVAPPPAAAAAANASLSCAAPLVPAKPLAVVATTTPAAPQTVPAIEPSGSRPTIGRCASHDSGPMTIRIRPSETPRNARTNLGSNWTPAQRAISSRPDDAEPASL